MRETQTRSGDALHGRGDRGISAGQLKRLMAGAWLIEQTSDDRGDVGTGDGATRDWRGREPDPAGGRSVVRRPGRRIVQLRFRERRSSSAAVFAAM